MDNWERFNETSLQDKKAFYSNLNIEDITDTDYIHANKVFEKIKLKRLGDYHDLYVQSDHFIIKNLAEEFEDLQIYMNFAMEILINLFCY